MKSKVFTVFLLVNCLCLSRICPTQACGYYETEADYRAMMFRAMLPSMRTMYPFNYTMSLYEEPLSTDPGESDRYRNCAEWLAACDLSVTLDDIYQIQYNTDSRLWLKASEKNAWKMYFPQNTFVQFLVKEQNKDLLDYMVFAKKIELTEVGGGGRFEEWENSSSYGSASYETDEEYPKEETVKPIKAQLLKTAWERLQTASIPFLKQRYAFQVCRLRYQVDKVDPEIAGADVFGRYFGRIQSDNLMSIWAGLFEAMRISPSETERYRLLVQVFSNSNEKKFRCVQLFEDRFDPDLLTSKELSTAIVMLAVRNPGRALDSIQKAYSLDRTNPYIPFLVLREINKLEDWMITPLFYGKYADRDPFECAYRWNKKEEITTDSIDETSLKLQAENNATDRQYLAQLKAFLEEIRPKNNDEIRDFYTIALAHLSLLQENAGDARKYLAQVSSGANASIRLQKQLETIWLAIKTQDVNSQSFQKVFLQNIEDLNRVATPNYNNKQMLYTLTLSLANEYLKAGRRVYGNLLRMKADLFRYAYEEYGWYDLEYRTGDNYVTLKYFDENANLADMDQLIGLLEKQSKTPFESYLCDQPLSSVDAYKDLKGTIAFRDNNLPVAYATFVSMPAGYWQSAHFSFSAYLNEDPFIPKGLRANKYRRFDYSFNKAEFVKTLMDLQTQLAENKGNKAETLIQLGNAYFNTSYWGNSWMMTRYGSSVGDLYYTNLACLPAWMNRYMTASVARGYYEQALKAGNDEQRAFASVMLFHIYACCYNFLETEPEKNLALKYGNQFRQQYKQTETFRMYECPGIKQFLASK